MSNINSRAHLTAQSGSPVIDKTTETAAGKGRPLVVPAPPPMSHWLVQAVSHHVSGNPLDFEPDLKAALRIEAQEVVGAHRQLQVLATETDIVNWVYRLPTQHKRGLSEAEVAHKAKEMAAFFKGLPKACFTSDSEAEFGGLCLLCGDVKNIDWIMRAIARRALETLEALEKIATSDIPAMV